MRVAAYCRYSSEGQRDGYSIEAQRKAIEDYCDREGHTVVEYYIDEAKTGTNDDRYEFQAMIAAASSKKFQAVIVHKLDRFARDRYDSAVYKKKLKDNGIRLISVLEPLDDSPESIMMESVLEGMAEYYSKNLAREVLKGKRVAAQKALHPGGMAPYGFKVNKDQQYELVPEETAVVRDIFAKADSGYSFAAIARYLKDSGIKNRQGSPISTGWISRLISNPLYMGQYVFGRRSKSGETIVVDDAVEAAVTKEVFDRVNELSQERIEKFKRKAPVAKNKGDDYVLTGYAYCGHCGSHLYGFMSRKQYKNASGGSKEYMSKFYRCARKVPREISTGRTEGCCFKNIRKESLEEFIFRSIENILFSHESLLLIVTDVKARLLERLKSKTDAAAIEREITKIKNQQQRLLDLYLDGSLDIPVYNSRKAELASQLEFYSDKLSRASVIDPDAITFEFVKSRIATFLESAKADSTDYQKLLLSSFVDSIVVDNEKIVIYFKFPVPPLNSDDPSFVRNRTTASACDTLRTELLIRAEFPLDSIWVPELLTQVQLSIQY